MATQSGPDWPTLLGPEATRELRHCLRWCVVLISAFVVNLVSWIVATLLSNARLGEAVSATVAGVYVIATILGVRASIRAQYAAAARYGLHGRDAWQLSLRGPDLFLASLAALGIEPPGESAPSAVANPRRPSVGYGDIRRVVEAAGGGRWEDLLGPEGYAHHLRARWAGTWAVALLLAGAIGAFVVLAAVVTLDAPVALWVVPPILMLAAAPFGIIRGRERDAQRRGIVARFRLSKARTYDLDMRSSYALMLYLALHGAPGT